jgi:alpha-mannosidase
MSITEQEINYALQSIAHNIDTLQGATLPAYKESAKEQWHLWEVEGLGTPIVVFNPHAWTVRMPVEVNAYATKMLDDKGNEIPFQIVRGPQTNGSWDKMQTIFMAEIEPMGYAVYRVFVKEMEHAEFENELSASENVLENAKIRVEFSRLTGDICRIHDKEKNCDILNGVCRAMLLDETAADTWSHGKTYLGHEVGQFDTPEFSVIENGPVRAAIRVTTRYNHSVLRRDYILEAGSNAVKVNVKVDFHEKHKVLKFAFPAGADKTIAKIPYGTITRANGLGEEPCGSWFASGSFAVANDEKYGYDSTEDEVRLTVLRSAIYADHFGKRDEFCEYMEQGIHECSYMVYPYESNAKADQKAEELNFGLRSVMDSFHEGKLPERKSCFTCDSEHIVVTAVKESEDKDGAVLRFYEADGMDENVSMCIFDKEIHTSIAHHEIKTFKTDGTEVNLIEWEEDM